MGLKDKHHRPYEPQIVEQAKAWVLSIACTKPKDHGLAPELWTISALARFVSESATDAGFPRLAKAGKSTVWRILDDNDIKPHKIRYYLEKRDPEFDRKMQEVLMGVRLKLMGNCYAAAAQYWLHSLLARLTRSASICSALAAVHQAPGSLSRFWTRYRCALSISPEPMGKPCSRAP